MNNNCKILILALFFSLVPLGFVAAGELTLPTENPQFSKPTSYFDHVNPDYSVDNDFMRHDGAEWTDGTASLSSCTFASGNCYDGHDGTDIDGETGDDIIAPADGVVEQTYWNSCGGNTMRVWHSGLGYSTTYGHLDDFIVTASESVERFEHIAEMGNSGSCTSGAHLHFGVKDAQTGGNVMDPYGWSGGGSDPWVYNQGRLWTTATPSLIIATVSVSGTISSNTTWERGYVYIVGNTTVSQGATLTVDPGAIVKFSFATARLTISGTLDVNGTTTSPVYFTSFYDDSVGGDTNGDGSSSGSAQQWKDIYISSTGTANFDHAIVRYGGNSEGSYANIENYGGTLIFTNSVTSDGYYGIKQEQYTATSSISYSQMEDNSSSGIRVQDGALAVSNSTIEGQYYGIAATIGTDSLTITDNDFINSGGYAIYLTANILFTESGNTATSSVANAIDGIYIAGTVSENRTWTSGLPYVLGSTTVSQGVTLTVDPGAIIKLFGVSARLTISGTLDVNGATASPVYFTSFYDDSVGGDTNGDGASSGAAQQWKDIYIDGYDGTANFDHAIVRYGGYASGGSYANIENYGGTLIFTNSETSNGYYGIKQEQYTATSSISYSQMADNSSSGIRVQGGSCTVSDSTIAGNSSYGIYSTGSAVSAEDNWWGDASGPYHATANPDGLGDSVSNNVDFDPFLTSAP
jgi:murein DD-endopeptidase MepM/ murein hydrolase activator NlpD